ncbi:MAG: hypothetical protein KDN22_04000 [Verrucomicrobiae bacterium]|nr:hypothetical protein [Verrucomicrobiae bacterium]
MFAGHGAGGDAKEDVAADTIEETPSSRRKVNGEQEVAVDSHEIEKSHSEPRSSFGGGGFALTGNYPTARPIPGAVGYVYSPFEDGDKAVDVSSLGKGVKARCPYSGKIFIVPDFAAPVEGRKSLVASSSSTSGSDIKIDEEEKKELRHLASSITKSAASRNTPEEEEPESEPRLVLPEPVLPPSPQESSGSLAEESGSSSEKILEGTRVAGRPGYVRSPYAGSNQLVDVTGLSPGQEVRCPYSGKLFKVPAMGEMSDVGPVEPKLPEPEQPTKPDVPTTEDEGDETPVAANRQPASEPEVVKEDEKESVGEDEKPPSIAKNGSPIDLSADTGGLARPVPVATAPESSPSLPVAKRIAGKKGLVRSPFGSEGQLVDVTGKSPGSQVLCPFTGKPFIVPK